MSRREDVRANLKGALDEISDLIKDDTTTQEGLYLQASAQSAIFSAMALTLAELTDVLDEEKPGLTQLADDLWLDLSEVQSVSTYTESSYYHRMVRLTTRNGKTYHVKAVHHQAHSTARKNDEALEKWLDENLRGKIL